MTWEATLGDVRVGASGLVGVADGAVADFGDPAGETRALFDGTRVVAPVASHGAVVVDGPDRGDFVQGQVSHDVRALPEGGARPALLLDHRGRPQAGLTVVRRPDDLYLAVDDGRAETVRAELERHVVFDQVTVRASSSLVLMVLGGSDVEALVEEALGLGAAAASALADPGTAPTAPYGEAAVLLHARDRGRARTLDVHLRAAELPSAWDALQAAGARPIGEGALAAARVDAGIAAAAFEGAEALPQEAGLDDRVSYRKGCYLGQEIMARIEARGRLHRGLARLELEGPPEDPSARAVVDATGRTVGRVGTAAAMPDGRWAALAVLRTDVPRPDAADAPVLHALGVRARAGAIVRA